MSPSILWLMYRILINSVRRNNRYINSHGSHISPFKSRMTQISALLNSFADVEEEFLEEAR